MLKLLENGYNVKLVETKEISIPVDRKEDIFESKKIFKKNKDKIILKSLI